MDITNVHKHTRAIPEVPGSTYWTTIFSTIYTSVERTSFTDSYNSYKSAADMTSLKVMTS